MTAEARIKSLEIFSHGLLTQKDEGGKSSSSYDDQDYDVVRNKKKRKEDVNYILVCTDRAARGVDFDGVPVDHVVIFDFPKDPAEYVRRVGRTGRAGRPGTCTVFAYGWQIPIARKIMGKKLENYTVGASSDGGDGGENVEYTTKQRREKREKDKMIGKNIQQGRLWE
jgi:ATP-dependent RNA helicase DDX18/HAS1